MKGRLKVANGQLSVTKVKHSAARDIDNKRCEAMAIRERKWGRKRGWRTREEKERRKRGEREREREGDGEL